MGWAVSGALGVRRAIAKGDEADAKEIVRGDGVWLDHDNILFLSRAAGEKEDSIYRMSIDGKNLKRLIKNARFPSVSAP